MEEKWGAWKIESCIMGGTGAIVRPNLRSGVFVRRLYRIIRLNPSPSLPASDCLPAIANHVTCVVLATVKCLHEPTRDLAHRRTDVVQLQPIADSHPVPTNTLDSAMDYTVFDD